MGWVPSPPPPRIFVQTSAIASPAILQAVDAMASAAESERRRIIASPWGCAWCGAPGFVLVCGACRLAVHGEWRV